MSLLSTCNCFREIFFASVYFSFWHNLICAVHSLHRKINDFSPSQYGKEDIIPIFITDWLPKLPMSLFLTFFKIQSFTLRLKFDISRRTPFWIIYTVWNKKKSASRKRFWRQNLWTRIFLRVLHNNYGQESSINLSSWMDIIQELKAIWVSLTSQKWTVRPSCWYFAFCWQLVLCPKQRPFTARTRTIMERDHWSVCYIVFFS